MTTAHEAGVVHRDLKPDNVMLTDRAGEEWVKVLDFGVAKLQATDSGGGTELTKMGTVIGTPEYMSPSKQAEDKSIPEPICMPPA